jgi:hypothetical protein
MGSALALPAGEIPLLPGFHLGTLGELSTAAHSLVSCSSQTRQSAPRCC